MELSNILKNTFKKIKNMVSNENDDNISISTKNIENSPKIEKETVDVEISGTKSSSTENKDEAHNNEKFIDKTTDKGEKHHNNELFNKTHEDWYNKARNEPDLNKKIEYYNKALELNPNYAPAWNNKGAILYNIGNYPEALKCYDKALELNPNYKPAKKNRKLALDKLKELESKKDTAKEWFTKAGNESDLNKKIEYYNKALELNPDYAYAWYNKGNALYKLGNYPEALECYDKALELNPNYVHAWYSKGLALYRLGNHSEAIKCYDKALELNPNYKEVENDRNLAIKRLKRLQVKNKKDATKKSSSKNKEASNKTCEEWYNKACSESDPNKKIEYFNKALELNPDYAYAWCNKGFTLYKMGNYPEALKCYNKALELNPKYRKAKKNKNELLRVIEQNKLKSTPSLSKPDKPDLQLSLGVKKLKINRWTKISIIIRNNGQYEIKNLTINISDDDFEIRRLGQVNISKNSSKTINFYLKPKSEGEIPLDIEAEFEYNNKKYTKSFFFEVFVEREDIYQTPKEQIKQPSDFTPRPLSTTSLPPELAVNYKNIELIGQGGFARVFKAVRIKDNIPVAIKIPLSLDQTTGKSFIKELENWTKLNHPNIVKVYDYNILPIPYFEMELCNTDLNEYLKNKKLSLREASFLIFNTAEGLKYAHYKNIIHRDLKPHNILLKNRMPKISDWGLSKVVSQSTSTTKGGFTPYYASPEQINGGNKDERTDIWQLGVIFYQLTTNKLPFEGNDFIELMSSITTKKPTPPKKINPKINTKLNNIILKCLNKKPEDRYQNILDLQKDLATYLQISFKEELTKSITKKDFSRSAFYCGDLVLIHLKSNNGVEAYKYIGDLINYAKGDIKKDLIQLKEAVKYRVENNIPIPYEVVASAEVIIHKVRLGFDKD